MLGNPYFKPFDPNEIDELLGKVARGEELERFPEFLDQCANVYRNQFLYSKDERFRGAVLAFTALREMLLSKRNGYGKKSLTNIDDSGKISVKY